MVQACILVRAESKPESSSVGRFIDLLEAIKKVDNVESAFIVYGRYDLVVFVDAPSFEEACKTTYKIHTLPGIESTETSMESKIPL